MFFGRWSCVLGIRALGVKVDGVIDDRRRRLLP